LLLVFIETSCIIIPLRKDYVLWKKNIYACAVTQLFLIANVNVQTLSTQWCFMVSWSVVATDVEREYHDEDEVGEMKRRDKARDVVKRWTRKRETETGTVFERRLVGVLVFFVSCISIEPRIKQPRVHSLTVASATTIRGMHAQCASFCQEMARKREILSLPPISKIRNIYVNSTLRIH